MYALLLLLTLTGNPLDDLNHDDFKVRQNATHELLELVCTEKEPIIYNQLTEIIQKGEPEAKLRASIILTEYFSIADNIEIPIWHLPREYRYVNGRDLGRDFFIEAIGPVEPTRIHCNTSKIMKNATKLYIRYILINKIKSRTEVLDIIDKMNQNYEKEQEYIKRHFLSHYLWTHDIDMYTPSAVEDRFKEQEIRIDAFKVDDLPEMIYDHHEEDINDEMFEG